VSGLVVLVLVLILVLVLHIITLFTEKTQKMIPDAEDEGSKTIEYDEFLMMITHKILKMTSDERRWVAQALKYTIVPVGRNRVDHRELGFKPLGP
jgi:hypothetical protein